MTGAGDEDADGGEKPRRLVSPLPDSAIPICRTLLSFFLFSSQLCLLLILVFQQIEKNGTYNLLNLSE